MIVSDEDGNRPINLAVLASLQRKLYFDLLLKRFDFAIALVEFCRRKMAVNRSSNASEFRQILSRLKEVQEKLERWSLASKLSDINGSLSIIEGNQAEFSDTVLQALDQMQTATQDGFRAMEERIFKFTGSQNKHPFESRGIKWKLNSVDATELCEKKKNCSPSWFVGKKRS